MKQIVTGVITYNQENVIGRALDSVLCQKDWGLYRLVISDDCSKDNTWSILKEYQSRYPEIVEIHQNEHNLGIYGNIEKLNNYLPQADLYCSLSGDDKYCEGYFEAVQRLIINEKVDTNLPVGFYSDWKSISPTGVERVFKQEAALSNFDLWSLKIRGLITGRSLMVTKAVRDKYSSMILDQGLALAEGVYDSQPHLNIDKAYYLPIITSVYYSELGVSTKLSIKNSDYFTTQHAKMWQYYIDHYIKSKKDLYYAKFELQKTAFFLRPTILIYIRLFYFYKKGQLPKYHKKSKETIVLFTSYFKYLVDYWIGKCKSHG